MRYLFAGGGTGGHIYPALAMARALECLDQQAQFLFIGSRRGLEKKIIPRAGYDLKTLDVQAFQRKISPDTVVTLFKAAFSLPQSVLIIREFQPDIVIGTGGYVSGPPCLAAYWLRIPFLLQEQNALPGVTTRFLASKAKGIMVGYSAAKERLQGKSNHLFVTGNPIRPEIASVDKITGCKSLGLDPGKKTLLVFGASQGSRAINLAFWKAWTQALHGFSDLQILWQTGESQYPEVKKMLGSKVHEMGEGHSKGGNLQLRSYIHDMPSALGAADLVVARAGAISLAEITARGLPSVLVPLPSAAENHQEHNARELEKRGAAKVILESDLSSQHLLDIVKAILENEILREKMALASRELGRPKAAEECARIVFKLAQNDQY